ncbi:MAG: hypothetical protein IJ242_03705 [Clostridia bacterium]|nr:hypothetical protein [Clostridia bacterium]
MKKLLVFALAVIMALGMVSVASAKTYKVGVSIYDSPTKSLFRLPDFNFMYLFRENDRQRRAFGICDNSERSSLIL